LEDTSTLKRTLLQHGKYNLHAETAEKGLIVANGRSLYENGVNMAFQYWNTTLPTTYLTGAAAYDAVGSTPIKQITQKWIANTINGYEGWIEYRRTGFPVRTISAGLNNNLIPLRMPYPAEEEALREIITLLLLRRITTVSIFQCGGINKR
jgi:hypothetical protein